jgi:hypothetical protein
LLLYLILNFLLLLTNFKNPSGNPLYSSEAAILAMKTFTRTRCGPEKAHTGSRKGHVNLDEYFVHPMRGGHRRKFISDRDESWYRNYEEASGQSLKLVRALIEASQSLCSL